MHKKPKKRTSGFTLTEVLVVVLIVAVLSAVVYPLYTKSITKSRAVEAINLLEMVRNKQIQNYAREREYFSEFTSMGRLTGNVQEEQVLSGGAQLKIKDYTLSLNNATKCMSAKYQKGSSAFTFSTSYENAGLGCTGSICTSFGDIIGDAKTVCNCGGKSCTNGYKLNEDTCNCDCKMACDQGGKCYDPYEGGLSRPCASGCGTQTSTASCNGAIWNGSCWSPTQEQPTTQKCGWNNSGTQVRSCSPTCAKGTCSAWGPCTGQQCDPSKKPVTSQNCGKNNTGTQTRTVTCNSNTGEWETGLWGPCTGQVCDNAEKPSLSQACGNCGTQTRTVTCNSNTGSWNAPSAWGTCSGQGVCAPGSTQGCGNGGTQSCNSSCQWNSNCTGQSCPAASKPSTSQGCGNCGTQSRTVTCDTNTGIWNTPGAWGTCSGQGSCSPGSTQSCGGGNGYQSCSSSCGWNTCSCNSGYTWNGSTCIKITYDCPAGSKPSASQGCGNCGTQTRSVTCDTSTGSWQSGIWGTCSGQGSCSPGSTQSCGGGNGSQSCSSSCGWNTCVCNSGYTWNGSTCIKTTYDCPAGSKPPTSQSCGKCGTQTRTVTCDTSNGNWQTGTWSTCTGQGTCSPGATQSCSAVYTGVTWYGTQTCSSSCTWSSCSRTTCEDDGCTCVGGRVTNCRWGRLPGSNSRQCVGTDSFGDLRICAMV